ncbi:MAG: hypothetical protein ACJAU0_002027 [Flavobacteriales bacterium]|jgi:hypothetical protein
MSPAIPGAKEAVPLHDTQSVLTVVSTVAKEGELSMSAARNKRHWRLVKWRFQNRVFCIFQKGYQQLFKSTKKGPDG